MPPVIFTSDPGRGKTSAISAFAERWRRFLVTIVPSTRQPEDVIGLPVVVYEDDDGGRKEAVAKFAPPDWVAQAWREHRAGRKLLLFLDELTTARPAVQAALLRLLAERRTDTWALPPDTWILAAANPPESAADGRPLEAAMANRLIWREWIPADLDDWVTAGVDEFEHPVPNRMLDDPALPLILSGGRAVPREHRARAWATVGAYLKARPSMRHAMPQEAERRSGPWPSERTWHYAAVCAAACAAVGQTIDDAAAWVRGCVGPEAAAEWLAVARRAEALPSIEAVLDGGADWTADGRPRDEVYLVAVELAAAIEASPTAARVERALRALVPGPRDVVAGFVGRIARAGLKAGWRPAGELSRSLAGFAELLK